MAISTDKAASSRVNWQANGFELSGPAKTRSEYRAAVAGSAPASC